MLSALSFARQSWISWIWRMLGMANQISQDRYSHLLGYSPSEWLQYRKSHLDCTPCSLWMVLGSDRILSLCDLSFQGPRMHLDVPKKRRYGRVKSARPSHRCSDLIASMKQQCAPASGDGLGPLRLWNHWSGVWCAWRDQQVVE